MKKTTKNIFSIVIVLMLNGCGTTLNLLCDREIYGGVIFDYGFAKEGVYRMVGKSQATTKHNDYGMVFLGSIDMPFSFVFDTVSLVYTLPYQLSGGGSSCSGMY